MPKKGENISLTSYDDLFETDESRAESQLERVQNIPVRELVPFKNHPFKVLDDEAMLRTTESIAEYGVLTPLIARPLDHGGYEIIPGHRRAHAAELAGLAEVPVLVRDMDDDAATVLMVDSNLQRENILPSERAFAYKMKLEALNHQGQRSDLTSVQVEQKLSGRWSRSILAEELGTSEAKVQRFIRLTHLAPELLALVDEGRMKMLPAVEVSYLSQEEQAWLFDAMGAQACTPSHAQAVKMKRYSKEGSLTSALVRSIMEEEKPNQVEQFKIPKKSIARFFRPSATKDEIESRIVRALELLEQAEARRGRQGGA
mgnify:CR=1 FL=1